MLTRCPSGRGDQVGQEGVGDRDQAQQVDLERQTMLLQRHFQKRAAEDDAGIVDQHVQRPALGVELIAQPNDPLRVGHIQPIRGPPDGPLPAARANTGRDRPPARDQ